MTHRSRRLLRWTGYIGIAIVFAIVCAVLSNWQFSRNAWRTEQLSLVESNYDAAPVALDVAVPTGAPFPADSEWQPVALRGEYLAEDQLLVRNRAHGGTSAYEVLVPFRLDDGRVLIVNRGWVRPGDEHAEPEAVPDPPVGVVDAVVRVRPDEELPSSGRGAPDGQLATINVPLIADTIGLGPELVPDAYGVIVSEDPAPVTAPEPLENPSADPGPYLSYAIQWILFAVMGFIFIGYVIRTEIKARREEDAEPDAPSPPRQRGRTRRDRDAVDEDALLDAEDSPAATPVR